MNTQKFSQEWEEVLHEVSQVTERLVAFSDDLEAVANGGNLTEKQSDAVYFLRLYSIASSSLFQSYLNSELEEAEKKE